MTYFINSLLTIVNISFGAKDLLKMLEIFHDQLRCLAMALMPFAWWSFAVRRFACADRNAGRAEDCK